MLTNTAEVDLQDYRISNFEEGKKGRRIYDFRNFTNTADDDLWEYRTIEQGIPN